MAAWDSITYLYSSMCVRELGIFSASSIPQIPQTHFPIRGRSFKCNKYCCRGSLRLSGIVRGKKWVISHLMLVLSNGWSNMATVRHKRWDPCLLYRTSLSYIGCNCLDFALTFNAGVTVIRINVYLYSYPLSDELTMYGLSGWLLPMHKQVTAAEWPNNILWGSSWNTHRFL